MNHILIIKVMISALMIIGTAARFIYISDWEGLRTKEQVLKIAVKSLIWPLELVYEIIRTVLIDPIKWWAKLPDDDIRKAIANKDNQDDDEDYF